MCAREYVCVCVCERERERSRDDLGREDEVEEEVEYGKDVPVLLPRLFERESVCER